MSVELITEASLKNFGMRFQCWPTVLLERDSTLANSCSGIEMLYVFFAKIHLFSYFFAGGSEKKLY